MITLGQYAAIMSMVMLALSLACLAGWIGLSAAIHAKGPNQNLSNAKSKLVDVGVLVFVGSIVCWLWSVVFI